jgi:hypothetical protein
MRFLGLIFFNMIIINHDLLFLLEVIARDYFVFLD